MAEFELGDVVFFDEGASGHELSGIAQIVDVVVSDSDARRIIVGYRINHTSEYGHLYMYVDELKRLATPAEAARWRIKHGVRV